MQEQAPRSEGAQEMRWDDHLVGFIKSVRRELKGVGKDFPTKEFRTHARAARREMLLAVRSLLDEAIAKTEEKEQTEPKASRIIVE